MIQEYFHNQKCGKHGIQTVNLIQTTNAPNRTDPARGIITIVLLNIDNRGVIEVNILSFEYI